MSDADVVAQIRERLKSGSPDMTGHDRRKLLSLLAARDARVTALESALREARGDVAAMIGAAQLMGVPKGNDGMVLALRRLREIDALLTGSTPDRRKADEPWRIPARVGTLVHLHNEGAWGTWEWQSDQVLFSPDAWRRLMGRRRTDWSKQ